MSETKTPLTLNRGKLELKKPLQLRNAGTKGVQVEVRKKRVAGQGMSSATSNLSDAAQAQKLKLLMEAKKLEEQKAAIRAEEEAKRIAEQKVKEAEQISVQEVDPDVQEEEAELKVPVNTVPSSEKVSTKENKKKHRDDLDDDEENASSKIVLCQMCCYGYSTHHSVCQEGICVTARYSSAKCTATAPSETAVTT